MSELSRKDFLRLTSWSLAAVLLPIGRLHALDSILSNNAEPFSEENFERAKEIARRARLEFYLKRYQTAEELYMQAIRLAPRYIQLYDGLDNVFGAQNRFLDSVHLFKNALLNNTGNVAFYDRAARSLMRLQTGCRNLAAEYRLEVSSASLLEDAAVLYRSAIEIDQTKLYLNIGLTKVLHKINIAPLERDYRINRVFKNLKRQNRNSYKRALESKTSEQIKELIDRVDRRERRELFTEEEIIERRINLVLQKKKFYDILQKREDISDLDRIENAERLFEIDYKDSNSLRNIKLVYYSNNKFFEFIEVRRKFAEAAKTPSSNIGLMDALEIAYRKNQAGSEVLTEALQIGTVLMNEWPLMFEKKVDLVIKMSKILLLQSRLQEAKELLERLIERVDLKSCSINNKLMQHYSKIYFEERNYNFVVKSMLIGVGELDQIEIDELVNDNPKYSYIIKLTRNKTRDTFKDNLDLYYLLYNGYFMLGDTNNSIAIINRLLSNNPHDSFVISRT
jgi:tetratricopeptide (TPR) repeat protein